MEFERLEPRETDDRVLRIGRSLAGTVLNLLQKENRLLFRNHFVVDTWPICFT